MGVKFICIFDAKKLKSGTQPHIKTGSLLKFIRSILFVKDTQSIIQVLKDLNKKKYHLAIVENEKGEFRGLVTLEDIVEEIVGEITDEFDYE